MRVSLGRPSATTLVVTVVAVLVLLGIGGVATGAIPATGTGKITACYAKLGGAMRVIDFQAGKRCRSAERKVAWNKRGPVGPQGPTGPQGPAGALGAPGATGPTGCAGHLRAG